MAIKKLNIASSVLAASLLTLDSGGHPDYKGYPMFANLLDMPYVSDLTILASRQVGKSIYVATRAVIRSVTPDHKYVYIAPSERQATDFSRLKLGIILEKSKFARKLLMHRDSPLLPPGEKAALNSITNDVYMKKFANSSYIKIGYAADAKGVERVRGGTADELTIDEAQSTDLDALMPVLKPMLTQAKRPIMNTYGTPLNENDSLVIRFKSSTQHTAVVKCEGCNRWTTLDNFRIIGLNGLICPRCGKPIDARNAKFVPMNPGSAHLGVHINRLMLPSTTSTEIKWQQLINDIEDPNTTEDGAMREIFGRPAGSSSEMIDERDIEKIAVLPAIYVDKTFEQVITIANAERIRLGKSPYKFMHAIDWGGGALSIAGGGLETESRTAEVLIGMHYDKGYLGFDILYHNLYPMAHPRHALDSLLNNMGYLPVKSIVTCDALGGTFAISDIRSTLNKMAKGHKFLPIQLGSIAADKTHNDLQDRIVVSKSNVVTKFFIALLHEKIRMQKDPHVIRELTRQFLAETEIENHNGKRIWLKKSGINDDILMASIFGFVAGAFFHEQALLK